MNKAELLAVSELKSVKYHESRNGSGMNADLIYKGKKIAHIRDEGRGGCFDYDVLGSIDLIGKDYIESGERKENKKLFAEFEVNQAIACADDEYNDIDCFIGELEAKVEAKKNEKKGFVLDNDTIMQFNKSLPQILKMPKGLSFIQKEYDTLTTEGKVITNTEYLKSIGVKIK